MMFHEELKRCLNEMPCTQKELAEAGNLPASTVNRYVLGKRVPESGSEQLEKILAGLQKLSSRKNYTGFSRENFYQILQEQREKTAFDYERFRENLSILIDTFDIKAKSMTKELYYESSYIQRIRKGRRRPSDPEGFAGKIAEYVIKYYVPECSDMAYLLGVKNEEIQTEKDAVEALKKWLCTSSEPLVYNVKSS